MSNEGIRISPLSVKFIKRFDANKDSEVTWEELKKSGSSMDKRTFGKLDVNGDGRIKAEEYTAYCRAKAYVEKEDTYERKTGRKDHELTAWEMGMPQKYVDGQDRDKDGRLNTQELAALFLDHPHLVLGDSQPSPQDIVAENGLTPEGSERFYANVVITSGIIQYEGAEYHSKGLKLNPDGSVDQGLLAKDTEINGLTYSSNTPISYHADRRVKSGVAIKGTLTVNGNPVDISAPTYVAYDEKGEVTAIKSPKQFYITINGKRMAVSEYRVNEDKSVRVVLATASYSDKGAERTILPPGTTIEYPAPAKDGEPTAAFNIISIPPKSALSTHNPYRSGETLPNPEPSKTSLELPPTNPYPNLIPGQPPTLSFKPVEVEPPVGYNPYK